MTEKKQEKPQAKICVEEDFKLSEMVGLIKETLRASTDCRSRGLLGEIYDTRKAR